MYSDPLDTDSGLAAQGSFEGKGASRYVSICLDTDRQYIIYLIAPPSIISSDVKIGIEVCHQVLLEPSQHVAVSLSTDGCEIISEIISEVSSEVNGISGSHHSSSWGETSIEKLQASVVKSSNVFENNLIFNIIYILAFANLSKFVCL